MLQESRRRKERKIEFERFFAYIKGSKFVPSFFSPLFLFVTSCERAFVFIRVNNFTIIVRARGRLSRAWGREFCGKFGDKNGAHGLRG